MTGPRVLHAPTVTERDFTEQVLDMARIFKWRRAHFRPARTATGWRTPVQGDGKGWLDLQLLRGPRLVVAELKVGKNKLTPEQKAWLTAWRCIPCAESYVWTPQDLDEIATVLRPDRTAA